MVDACYLICIIHFTMGMPPGSNRRESQGVLRALAKLTEGIASVHGLLIERSLQIKCSNSNIQFLTEVTWFWIGSHDEYEKYVSAR
jgi:hypothetical protein